MGIDPHSSILELWGLPDTATGARELGLRMVEAAHSAGAGIVKPQVAFFERHASAGYSALEEVLAAAREAGLLVIADVKRGEIGTSMAGYADAWLRAGSPLEADAITLNPYLGPGSLDETIALARAEAKGVFLLAATSNPEGGDLQRARLGTGATVAGSVVEHAVAANAPSASDLSGDPLGDVGVVIGATLTMGEAGIDAGDLVRTPVLAPGFGAQGAEAAQLHSLYGVVARNVLVSASRSLVDGGVDLVVSRIRELDAQIEEGPR